MSDHTNDLKTSMLMDDAEKHIIEPRDIINGQIFDKEPPSKNKRTFWNEVIRDGFVAVAILIVGSNIFTIITCLVTFFNAALLFFAGVNVELPVAAPITFDMNLFLESAQPYEYSEEEIYSFINSYASYDSFYEIAGIALPQYDGEENNVYDGLQYNSIQAKLDTAEKYGELTIHASFNENALVNYAYEITALFAIDGYTPDSTKVAFDQKKATYIYEYADGQKAYFVKNFGSGTQNVYFENDGILYTFELEDSEESVANAQKLIEIMSEGAAYDELSR